MSILGQLRKVPLIAILRHITGETADRTVEALYSGGIRFVEVTLNTDGALDMIRRWRHTYDGELMIGAGTVLDLDDAKKAADAGAQYFVSPHTDERIVQYAVENELGVFPGALTPTEIVHAWRSGATAVKIFPNASIGLAYIQELQGPLGHIPMIPTGGITLDNIIQYFDAGVCAVGIGSQLADRKLITAGQFDEIRKKAKAFAEKARSAARSD